MCASLTWSNISNEKLDDTQGGKGHDIDVWQETANMKLCQYHDWFRVQNPFNHAPGGY
jgi:hypothetical protein